MIDAAEPTTKKFVDVPLDNPLVRGEQSIASIQLRKPMAGDLRGVKLVDLLNLDVVSVSRVIPRISTPVVTTAEFMSMDGEDVTALAGEVAAFLLSRRQKAEAGLEA